MPNLGTFRYFTQPGYGWVGDPNAWSPNGAPAPGDTLLVRQGVPFAGDGVFGMPGGYTAIELAGASAATSPALLTWNESYTKTAIDNFSSDNSHAPAVGQVVIADTVSLDPGSSITAASDNIVPGTAMYVWDAPGSTLLNYGMLDAGPRALLAIDGGKGSTLINNGNIIANGGNVAINSPITGTGQMSSNVAAMQNANIELGQSVGGGQSVYLGGGGLTLDDPKEFLGSVNIGPGRGAVVLMDTVSASWKTAASGTLLELFNSAGAPVDILRTVAQPNAQFVVNQYTVGVHQETAVAMSYVPPTSVPQDHGIVTHVS